MFEVHAQNSDQNWYRTGTFSTLEAAIAEADDTIREDTRWIEVIVEDSSIEYIDKTIYRAGANA